METSDVWYSSAVDSGPQSLSELSTIGLSIPLANSQSGAVGNSERRDISQSNLDRLERSVSVFGIALNQVQNLLLGSVEFNEICMDPPLKPEIVAKYQL